MLKQYTFMSDLWLDFLLKTCNEPQHGTGWQWTQGLVHFESIQHAHPATVNTREHTSIIVCINPQEEIVLSLLLVWGWLKSSMPNCFRKCLCFFETRLQWKLTLVGIRHSCKLNPVMYLPITSYFSGKAVYPVLLSNNRKTSILD